MAPTTQQPTVTARKKTSSIGLKILMAITGVIFLLFVTAHMYGNLMAFGGPTAFDEYAEHLRTLGEPMLPYGGFLWVMRIGLIASLVIHVACAVILALRARAARPVKYAVKKNRGSTFSSQTMRWGGAFLLLFVVFHILQFTTLTINVNGEYPSPYQRLVAAFNVWWVVLIYVLAMIALGMHLRHGVFSSLQTLGLTQQPRSQRIARVSGLVVAIVIAGGFLLAPLFIAFGVIT